HHRRQNKQTLRSADWIESDLDRKFAAVFPTAKKIASGSHGTIAGLGEKNFAMLGMPIAETFWNQRFDIAADQLAQRIAEDSCGLRVGEVDHTGGVDHEHRVRRGIEHEPEFFFRELPLGDVNA